MVQDSRPVAARTGWFQDRQARSPVPHRACRASRRSTQKVRVFCPPWPWIETRSRAARYTLLSHLYLIYDEEDRLSIVKEAMRQLDMDERQTTPASVVHRISSAKNHMLSVEEAERLAREAAAEK